LLSRHSRRIFAASSLTQRCERSVCLALPSCFEWLRSIDDDSKCFSCRSERAILRLASGLELQRLDL
jgi:hypothetical protein